MRRTVLIAFAVLLAGCAAPVPKAIDPHPSAIPLLPATLGVVHRAGSIVTDPAVVAAVGGEYLTGSDATEPSVGVDKLGHVYMTAYGALGASNVARSIDHGQTWDSIGPTVAGQNEHPTTFDPILYLDPDTDRLYLDDLTPPCNLLSWTDDHGEMWTTNPVACGTLQLNDHQTIVAAAPRVLKTVGYPKLLYFCANQITYMGCAVSPNGGLTFLPQVPVVPTIGGDATDIAADKGCMAITGHLKADHEGRVFLGMRCDAHPAVSYTENDGASWATVIIDTTTRPDGHDVDLAVDDENGLYAVWNDNVGYVHYSHSEDHGHTWAPSVNVTFPGVTATMFASVAAGAPGHLAFGYVGTTIPGGYKGKPLGNGGATGDLIGEPDPPEWATATWNAYLGVMVDGRAADPTIQTVTANDPADPIARGLCGGTRCHGMNDFIDVQVGTDGRPWASFVDVCTAKCIRDTATHYDTSVGFVATLQRGPALRGTELELPLIAPPPVKTYG